MIHYVGGLDDIERSGCTVTRAVVPAIKVERSGIPRCNGKVRGYFSGASAVHQGSTKKEGVTGEESDDKLSRFILNECAKVLDPTGEL